MNVFVLNESWWQMYRVRPVVRFCNNTLKTTSLFVPEKVGTYCLRAVKNSRIS